MFKLNVLFILIFLFSITTSCRHDPDLSSLKAVSFANDIQPIIASNCSMSGCHSDNSSGGHDEGAFSLTTYEDVMDHGEIEAGNAHKSKFYQAISNQSGELMPPPPRSILSDDQIRLVYVWIEQGAKDN